MPVALAEHWVGYPDLYRASANKVEQPTIERLHAAIVAAGFRPRGRHQEIYLGDPRRADPSRLKTILRQPYEAP